MQQVTVLYVEDHDLVLFTVKQLLELEGWRVRICRDGGEALRHIKGDEHFDLIITDAELPTVSGFELIRKVRTLTHRQSTPVLCFTANDCGDEAIAAGAVAYLKKPGGIKDLIATCNRYLHSDTPDAADLSGQPGRARKVGNA